jgi:hypothetical protein
MTLDQLVGSIDVRLIMARSIYGAYKRIGCARLRHSTPKLLRASVYCALFT